MVNTRCTLPPNTGTTNAPSLAALTPYRACTRGNVLANRAKISFAHVPAASTGGNVSFHKRCNAANNAPGRFGLVTK